MMKKKLYDLLENDEINNGRKFTFNIVLAIIIVASIIIIFFENEKGEVPPYLQVIDNGFTIFFIIEFLARFYVSSDFKKDIKNKSLSFAIMQKVKWFFSLRTIIDFLAIIPSVRYFRVFRTLRFLRLFRVFKAYRSIKTFREIDKILIILKGMKEESRIFYVFFSFTVFFVLLISFALYMSESGHNDSEFNSFKDSIWYAIKKIGFGDDTPKTGLGKFFAGILRLLNITIFSFFVSLILNKIQNIMKVITSGTVGKIKLKNHIIICGYTKSSQNVIEDLLKDNTNINNIVLVTQKEVEDDISGVILVRADYTELKTMLKVNISEAKFAIIFAESKESDTLKDVDLRTVMTIFNIEKEAPQVHTIAEINDKQNAEIIKDKIDGDEILYKEMIDSRIILSCINHKHISNMFYEMFGTFKNERLAETKLSELGLPKNSTVKDVKLNFLEKDITFLGFIDDQNNSYLSPKNNEALNNTHRLIYLI